MRGDGQCFLAPLFEGLEVAVVVEEELCHVVLHTVHLKGREYGVGAPYGVAEILVRVGCGGLAEAPVGGDVERAPHLVEEVLFDVGDRVEVLAVDIEQRAAYDLVGEGEGSVGAAVAVAVVVVEVVDYHFKSVPPALLRAGAKKRRRASRNRRPVATGAQFETR